jgi:bifunctional non-homologous end joining protein LigD
VDDDSLPGLVRPMLATPGALPVGPGWAVEFKWDGIRAIVAAGGGRVRVWSRNANDVTNSYPELVDGPTAAALAGLGSLLVDGEIVALDHRGRPEFTRLAQRMHVRAPTGDLVARVPVLLYVFDLLDLHGRSLLGEAYDDRRAELTALHLDSAPHVAVPPSYTDVTAAQLMEVARAHRLEGVVSKRRRSRYEPGRRSPAWVKTPLLNTQEVLVGGWTPGQGRRAGTIGALLLGAFDGQGQLRYLGHVGTGFTDVALDLLTKKLAPLAQSESAFDEEIPAVEARAARWVRPSLVGEVVYRTLTPDHRLRHASWRGLRPDRDPEEVVLEPAT